MRELGRRIRLRRLRLKLSLRAVAGQLGKSHAWLKNLEDGVMEEPKSEDLTAIAVILGDDPAEYLKLAGRVNLAAAKIVPGREGQPDWARRLEEKVDALSEAVRLADEGQEASSQRLAELLGLVKALLPREEKRATRGPRTRPGAARPALPEIHVPADEQPRAS